MEEYGLYINGEWIQTEEKIDVLNKYSREQIGKISVSTKVHIDQAVAGAVEALKNEFSSIERYELLMRVANRLVNDKEKYGEIIAQEVGKPLGEAIGEVERSAQTLIASAEEAKRLQGEVVPIESARGSENRIAFTVRVPVGVIAAITPFNVPLNLVCHKVGPALAAGNSILLKPAEKTSIIAIALVKLFEEEGCPKGRLNLLTGRGRHIGDWFIENENIHMFTFTGSPSVGAKLKQKAGMRKVALELGNNSATIVHSDADIEKAAKLISERGYNNAGQVCISVQRVFVHESIKEAFLKRLKTHVEQLVVGDPFDPKTFVGPMISEDEAIRVEQWVEEAVKAGAELITGGKREGSLYYPTILDGVTNEMKVSCEEVFGPVVSIFTYENTIKMLEQVNESKYGLQAGLFTNDLSFAMNFAKKVFVGGVIVNDTSAYRVDHMPYGGVKESGDGKEGPKYAIKEMTEERLVVFNI